MVMQLIGRKFQADHCGHRSPTRNDLNKTIITFQREENGPPPSLVQVSVPWPVWMLKWIYSHNTSTWLNWQALIRSQVLPLETEVSHRSTRLTHSWAMSDLPWLKSITFSLSFYPPVTFEMQTHLRGPLRIRTWITLFKVKECAFSQ